MSEQTRRVTGVVLAVLVVLSAGAAPVGAQSQTDTPVTEMTAYEAFSAIADEYNERAPDEYLGVSRYLLAGERVNVYVEYGDGLETFSFALDDQMRVSELSPYHRDDATARLETDRATVERIMTSSTPTYAFLAAYSNDDVRIRGEQGDVVAQATWTLAKVMKSPLGDALRRLGWGA